MADRTVTYDFRANITDLQAKMAAGGRAVGDFGTKLTALDKNGAKMRAGLDTLGRSAGRIGLVAAVGLGAVVKVAADFDQAMSNIAATGPEAVGSIDALREAAIKAGAETAFSAGEAASGIENLLKAGVSVSDVLGGGLAGSLDLAAAGELEVADAAELAATALTQFKLEGSDVGHVADLLAAGAGKAQGDVSDLGMALKQSGLVAAQTGLSIEETVGTLSAFASAGLLGSDAGTSFKTMLQSLTPTGEKAAEKMAELGISAYDAQGNFIGMTEFAGVLRNGLADLSVEQQNAALKTIFGSDAVRAAAVIYDQGADGIQGWIDKTNDAGYAAETAATRLDNLKGDLEALGGSLETALIGAGSGSQGMLRELVQGATALVNVFNSLPGPLQSAATGLLAITAVTGGGLWFGSKVIGTIVDTRQALADLGPSGAKAASALGAVGKAALGLAALQVAVAGIQAINEATQESLPGLEEMTSRLRDLGQGQTDALGGEFDSLAASIDRIDPNAAQKIGGIALGVLSFGQADGRHISEATAEIEALDSSLANLVNTGQADAAANALAALADSGILTYQELGRLRNELPQYDEALIGAKNSAIAAGDANSDYAGATGEAGDAAGRSAAEVNELADAMRDQRTAAI